MKPIHIVSSLVSGLFLTLGFPKTQLFALAWVALVPLLWAARRVETGREAAILGLLCGVVHYLTTLYWIQSVIEHYGGLPGVFGGFVLLLLCLYLAIYPTLFTLVAWKWRKEGGFWWVAGLPAVWVALEWGRAHAITGFPWASLGYTQTPWLSLIQVADVTGVYGVSWLIVLANASVELLLRERRRGAAALGVFSLLLALTLGYGSLRTEEVRRWEAASEPVTVGVVQANIDQSQKWEPTSQQETLRRYRELTLRASRGGESGKSAELLVWPETATPFFYGLEEPLTSQTNAFIREGGKPVLFGSPGIIVPGSGGTPRLQNRAYLVDGDTAILGGYAKQHLVPFGEYVPLQQVLFFVKKLVEAAGDFVPGHDSSPLRFGRHALGVLICYEDIFPELARRTAAKGATMLVNITNDAWFGDSSAPYQHLEMARWRAVECRMPLVRAANTGVSAVFDATGRTCGTIPLNTEGVLVCPVQPLARETLYGRWGDVFAALCLLTALAGLFYLIMKEGRTALNNSKGEEKLT